MIFGVKAIIYVRTNEVKSSSKEIKCLKFFFPSNPF